MLLLRLHLHGHKTNRTTINIIMQEVLSIKFAALGPFYFYFAPLRHLHTYTHTTTLEDDFTVMRENEGMVLYVGLTHTLLEGCKIQLRR